jgi:hypothetical protein
MEETKYYLNRHHIDVHLTTTSKPIHNFIDQVLNEIATTTKIQSRSRSREVLKKFILNLIQAHLISGCVQYSRNKNDYSLHRFYGLLWLKYDRIIQIVDGLIEHGYVEHLNGYYDKKKKSGLQSKIWASEKFIDTLNQHIAGMGNIVIEREQPKQIILLKNKDKEPVPYNQTRDILIKRRNLNKYNRFINEQFITVELPEKVVVDNRFWAETLLNGLLNGMLTLNDLTLNKEIQMEDVYAKSDEIVEDFVGEACSEYNTNLCSINSNNNEVSKHSTINSATSIQDPYSVPSIPYSTTNSIQYSTLYSHIELLSLLYRTKEKRQNALTDMALLLQKDTVMNCFLNWLIFFNKDLKTIHNKYERKEAYKILRSVGDIGIQHLSIRLKYEYLYRVFNRASQRFDKGGRFYGAAHLSIPRHLRGFIHINGAPIVELDYDAFHTKMLYHQRGMDITTDPYGGIEGPEPRKIKKTALLTAINAETDKEAVQGIRRRLIRMGIRGEPLKNPAIYDLLARVTKAHPYIAEDIGSDKGIGLQNIDSDIAENILINFMEMGIPVLPVHDSFIVPAEFEAELEQHMIEQYQKHSKLNGFKPTVSKKDKEFSPK